MKLISHRGNTVGKFESWENEPTYIDKAIKDGYDVEIDVWLINNMIYLGHNKPQYDVDNRWLKARINKLWIHCKNVDALIFFNDYHYDINYFWHQEDDFTLTNKNHIWTFPGKRLSNLSIAVLPETVKYEDKELYDCYGICSDFIEKYKN